MRYFFIKKKKKKKRQKNEKKMKMNLKLVKIIFMTKDLNNSYFIYFSNDYVQVLNMNNKELLNEPCALSFYNGDIKFFNEVKVCFPKTIQLSRTNKEERSYIKSL